MYKTNRDKDLNTYAEYNINDDLIYINDINLQPYGVVYGDLRHYIVVMGSCIGYID